MAPERWQQLDRLFQAAVSHPADEQTRFLRQACGPDSDLRAEVAELLAHAEQATRRIKDIAGSSAEALVQHHGGQPEAPVAGRYKILKRIGQGGMGTVYLAERVDGCFRKHVAVKFARFGLSGPEVLWRFQQERQTLARLEHPGIARLLDGGATPDGRPFLVMEYVRGESIERYCNRNRLSLCRRLQLFCDVLVAVHHAHEHRIVHRDLKPGNILVTPAGAVKLLDFGICKVLGDYNDNGLDPTLTTGRAMTPQYSSPEQIRGDCVTEASDIYALGVILYKLLCGHLPYAIDPQNHQETAQLICEIEPPKPSQSCSRTLCRVAPDGRRIVSDPAGVAAARSVPPHKLTRQLQGDLDTLVLKALSKEPDRRYRSALALRDDIRRYLRGEAITAHPPSIGYRARKFCGRHRIPCALTAAGVVLLSVCVLWMVFQHHTGRELEGIARRQALRQARLHLGMGRAHFLDGRFREAEQEFRAGLSINRSLPRPDPRAVAENLMDLGMSRCESADYGEAALLLREAHRLYRRALGAEHPEVARAANCLGVVYSLQGRLPQAERLLREGLRLRLAASGNGPEVASSLGNLAFLFREQGNLARAEGYYRRSLAMLQRHVGQGSPVVAKTLSNLACVVRDRGRGREARELFEQALETQRAVLRPGHPDIAYGLCGLAKLLLKQGEASRAAVLLQEALAARRKALPANHWLTAQTSGELGCCLAAMGSLDAARPLIVESHEMVAASLGKKHKRTGEALQRVIDFTRNCNTPRPAGSYRALPAPQADVK